MWSRDRNPEKIVPGEPAAGPYLRWFGQDAAIPVASIYDTKACRRLELKAPGARASNTEVCWDESSQRLLVGVWCGSRPDWQRPLKFPGPELLWFRSFHLPNHDGRRAQARVARGVIAIEVPTQALESAQPRHVLAEQVQDDKHTSNVIPLPRRREIAGSGQDSLGASADQPSSVGVACRWFGTAISLALCLPVLLFSLFLFGFVLIPLLPFIAGSLALGMDRRGDVPPPVRPNVPATARPAPAFERAQAA